MLLPVFFSGAEIFSFFSICRKSYILSVFIILNQCEMRLWMLTPEKHSARYRSLWDTWRVSVILLKMRRKAPAWGDCALPAFIWTLGHSKEWFQYLVINLILWQIKNSVLSCQDSKKMTFLSLHSCNWEKQKLILLLNVGLGWRDARLTGKNLLAFDRR